MLSLDASLYLASLLGLSSQADVPSCQVGLWFMLSDFLVPQRLASVKLQIPLLPESTAPKSQQPLSGSACLLLVCKFSCRVQSRLCAMLVMGGDA